MSNQMQTTEKPAAKGGSLVRNLLTVLVAIVVAAAIFLNLFTHVLPMVRYYGDGMEPSLSGGQTLLLLKTGRVSQGDIVAFYYNNSIIVRRVIATEGSQVIVEEDGTVLVNGTPLDEPYVAERSIGQSNQTYPVYVPSGQLFVMGDNRPIAMDSRLSEIGLISTDRVLGKLLLTF